MPSQVNLIWPTFENSDGGSDFAPKQILKDNGYNIPIITTLHGTDITLVGNHPFYKPAVTFSINNSDIVTCVSESLELATRCET